ncbi:MAG: bifunctional DNA-binding transcriptional regulator/O6-methylguanine-DNA methyltransferase Ada [Acidobacteriales bacterium]|nr:bifunctional DNA-binding transcriptional regulator/O6-methylguanine-DNA methyltransferase Ada [Terriglobales bacterium]
MATRNLQPAAAPDVLWQAVLARNRDLDGVFFYGVKSTGIFCRPTCPSRRPRRDQVDFYFDPRSAERAGFRACRRCRPTEAQAPNPQAELVHRVCRYIEESLEATLTLRTISHAVESSPFHLQRTFKHVLGITPQEYVELRRVAVFRAAVRHGQPIVDATYEAGFNSSRGVYERAHAHLGMTPSSYQKGAPGQQIAYAIAESPLGNLLVARTEKGICKVALGDDAGFLGRSLAAEFPKAEIREDRSSLQSSVKAILGYLNEKQTSLDLPLDLQATAFQMRVWRELQKIPYGQTMSYEEIARRIRQPKATRAVARACATNPVALVVPCHRVVRKDGSMGGYRWGVERKGKLLGMESAKF